MLLIKTSLRLSPIHGIGLFAEEPIKKGQEVWRWSPGIDRCIPIETFNAMHPGQQEYVKTYAWLEDGCYMLCADNNRFANHSDAPNLGSDGRKDVALRDIAAGEELTYDYWTFHEGTEL